MVAAVNRGYIQCHCSQCISIFYFILSPFALTSLQILPLSLFMKIIIINERKMIITNEIRSKINNTCKIEKLSTYIKGLFWIRLFY